MKKPISLPAWIDSLQARGRYTITSDDIRSTGEWSDLGIRGALRRLRKAGRIASPKRGFHVIVPLEHKLAGCPPASWFIDDLMCFMKVPYYVGVLTAAAIHGAAHQQPMVFQVITIPPLRPIEIGRNRIVFHRSSNFAHTSVEQVRTETGSMCVATPEATAFDLVRFYAAAGFFNNVATVLTDLVEKIDAKKLAKQATAFGTPDIQRLGYLLQLVDAETLTDGLTDILDDRRARPTLLDPKENSAGGPLDEKWNIIVNTAVEADI